MFKKSSDISFIGDRHLKSILVTALKENRPTKAIPEYIQQS